MQEFFLCRYIHYCIVDDGIIFMDLRSGTYFGVGVADAIALSKLVRGLTYSGTNSSSVPDVEVLIDTLLRRQVLTRDEKAGKSAADIAHLQPAVAHDLTVDFTRRAKISVHHVVNFLIAYFRARVQLRWRSLAQIVASVDARKRASDGKKQLSYDTDSQIQYLVRVFRRLRPLVFSSSNACLLDSLVLVEFLSRYELFPYWVFGVRTRPFAAHSWVQEGTMVLNGTVDYTERYVPLLAV